jgi:hypothetical protein
VPGCGVELARGKAYNSRYRICEEHRSAEEVWLPGAQAPARFCQMCAKFEGLGAFEGSKMSCREKLAEHNARRRAATRAAHAQARAPRAPWAAALDAAQRQEAAAAAAAPPPLPGAQADPAALLALFEAMRAQQQAPPPPAPPVQAHPPAPPAPGAGELHAILSLLMDALQPPPTPPVPAPAWQPPTQAWDPPAGAGADALGALGAALAALVAQPAAHVPAAAAPGNASAPSPTLAQLCATALGEGGPVSPGMPAAARAGGGGPERAPAAAAPSARADSAPRSMPDRHLDLLPYFF